MPALSELKDGDAIIVDGKTKVVRSIEIVGRVAVVKFYDSTERHSNLCEFFAPAIDDGLA